MAQPSTHSLPPYLKDSRIDDENLSIYPFTAELAKNPYLIGHWPEVPPGCEHMSQDEINIVKARAQRNVDQLKLTPRQIEELNERRRSDARLADGAAPDMLGVPKGTRPSMGPRSRLNRPIGEMIEEDFTLDNVAPVVAPLVATAPRVASRQKATAAA